ncbi:hypothetical protein BX286_6015 [Streptomyces sp. 3211.6]|uniref:hypothetical protein n=1 Tax=Streptomyces TaxID=1883 RepID=UPI0009A4A845|nr:MULTISPECIES: hypothetical protein [Streptomyces]RKT07938.1 hypothetical protein BX286_6015 [Streptomyces sp. 3211.6]RPF44442.1 hypothetical protein EDD96_0967 [Streptomyces sp. Ag109_G2-6]
MRISYQISEQLYSLGFDPGSDKYVGAIHSELNMYTGNERDALRIWGWDPNTLTDADRYKIDQLLRMFVFQENQILSALRRLDEEYRAYLESNPEAARQAEAFTQSLQDDLEKQYTQLQEWAPSAESPFPPSSSDLEWLRFSVQGVMSFMHPEIARNTGPNYSLAMGGMSFTGNYWRLKDNGYARDRIPDGYLYDLIDTAIALQAEFQLQALLTDREFTRIITTRGQEFEWLKAEAARKAAAEQGGGFWSLFGDILGIVSAVSGVLALIPVFTPIAGPIAVVTAVASLGAHTVDASIKGDWDATTFAGLGADALAALPGIGAVAKSLKAGRAAMKTIGTAGNAVSKASVVSKTAGRTFLATTGGSAASDASAVFNYIGTKGAKVVSGSATSGKIAGKVLQGSVNLSTQVPLVVELASGTDMSDPKTAATGAALTANYGQSIGSWGAVGAAAKKSGTVSLALFAGIIGRR